MRHVYSWIMTAVLLMALSGCGGGGGTASTGGGTGTTTVASLSIATSDTSLPTDNTETATITVTALTASNAVIPGVAIDFQSTGGQLSSSQAVTDANGRATVTFTPGTTDKSNQTVSVTASASGASSVVIPIQVTGSTAVLAAGNTNLSVGGATTTVTVTLKDAAGVPVFAAPVTLTASSNPGDGTLGISPASGNTDVNGQITATISGASAGPVTLTASGLGATSTAQFQVSSAGQNFAISTPASDPVAMSSGGTLNFTVNAPSQTQVRFATTIGTWAACGAAVCTVNVAGGSASTTLSANNAGVANIQVDGLTGGTVTATDTHTVAISAPCANATTVSMQSSVSVVPPSTGGVTNSATLSATVRDAGNQPVGECPVAFSIINPTGGGESISPVVGVTASNVTDPNLTLGEVRSTFNSGSLPSGQSQSSVTVRASVIGTGLTSDVNIVIGGTPGSVVIGQGSKIIIVDPTNYDYPLSVLVADSNGNPVSGATVTMSVWPVEFSVGSWTFDGGNCGSGYSDGLAASAGGDGLDGGIIADIYNEDANENLIEDAGEDQAYACGSLRVANSPYCLLGNAFSVASDATLTPLNSTAGTLPGTVSTDSNGVASFNLRFLKQYSNWIRVRVRASTQVQGTETTSSVVFRLPGEKGEVEACELPNSPFN